MSNIFMDNDNAVYLGDIDPNNKIISAMDIRRTIMFQLLIWDRIILSDSQFLTDPRLNVLMGRYNGKEVIRKYQVDDVTDFHKGIETLFENGFIEIALRENRVTGSSLSNTWNGMKKSEKPVPYLPEDEKYVEHLMSFDYRTHIYETTNIASMFQEKLLRGIETNPQNGGIILQSNDVEKELKRMFNERIPLFRNMLDYLRVQRNEGAISHERFIELYDYVYGCYNVNISETLHCNINTKFAHIPFHIDSGEEYIGNNPKPEQVDRLRPTWALNPLFLDYLSFDEFIEIKKRLKTSKVREFYLGNIESPWVEIESAWEEYIEQIELRMKNALLERMNMFNEQVFAEFGIDKFLAKPRQQTIIAPTFEIVKSVVSSIPIVSEAVGVVDSLGSVYSGVVTLSKRKKRIVLAEEHSNISKLISRETKVVTKY